MLTLITMIAVSRSHNSGSGEGAVCDSFNSLYPITAPDPVLLYLISSG